MWSTGGSCRGCSHSHVIGQATNNLVGEGEQRILQLDGRTVLEHLFDFYYTELPQRAARREVLNAKLREAGRKPLDEDASRTL